MNTLLSYGRAIIFSSVWIAFAASVQLLYTYEIMGTKVDLSLLAFTFFSTLFVYNFDSISHSAEDFKQKKELIRDFWLIKHKNSLAKLSIFSFIMMLFFSYYLQLNDILFLLPLGIVSILYSFPLLQYHGKYILLKNIPGLKTLLIAFVWSSVTVLIPFYRKHGLGELNFSSSMILIERFLLIGFVCFQFDIRDIDIDKKLKIRSLPSIIGVKLADLISIAFLVLGIGLGYYQSLHDTYHISILVLPFMVALGVRACKSLINSEFYYSFWIDGVMVFPLVFLIV